MAKEHIQQTKEFLESAEFIPIGSRIEMLENLLKCLEVYQRGKTIPLPRNAYGSDFLKKLSEKQRANAIKLIQKNRKELLETLEDMQTTFKKWKCCLKKEQIKKISIPEGLKAKYWLEKNPLGYGFHVFFFTFKNFKKWVAQNTDKELVCSNEIAYIQKKTFAKNSFGFAVQLSCTKKEIIMGDIQLLVFRKKGEPRSIRPPMKKAHFAMLYCLFRLIEKKYREINKISVNISGRTCEKMEKNSIKEIYNGLENICTMTESREIHFADLAEKHLVFVKRN